MNIIRSILNSEGFRNFLDTYNLAVTIILAIVTITVLALLFINIAKLSTCVDNERERSIAIRGILTCLICLGFTGGVDAVYAILISLVFGMG